MKERKPRRSDSFKRSQRGPKSTSKDSDRRPPRSTKPKRTGSYEDRFKKRNTSLPPYARSKPSQRAPTRSFSEYNAKMEPHRQLQGVYTKGKYIYTLSQDKTPVYGETIKKVPEGFLREWNPARSKLGAGIVCQVSQIGIKPSSSVLYLGAASGTTVSHVCDITGPKGPVYAVEFSHQPTRRLLQLTSRYPQLVPIIADARDPQSYTKYIEPVDVVFQDVAQPDQVRIFVDNCLAHLKKGGFGLLSLKAKSVDVTASPNEIFKRVEKELSRTFPIVDKRKLDPLQKGHMLFVIKKK